MDELSWISEKVYIPPKKQSQGFKTLASQQLFRGGVI